MIMKCRVHTPEQAVLYLTDCTLATVGMMASKKSRGKCEYQRQISIAQTGFDWLLEYPGIIETSKGSRVLEIRESHNGSVADWAKKYEQSSL
jgi:hypothetical protein